MEVKEHKRSGIRRGHYICIRYSQEVGEVGRCRSIAELNHIDHFTSLASGAFLFFYVGEVSVICSSLPLRFCFEFGKECFNVYFLHIGKYSIRFSNNH
jgi:hypothetical protein